MRNRITMDRSTKTIAGSAAALIALGAGALTYFVGLDDDKPVVSSASSAQVRPVEIEAVRTGQLSDAAGVTFTVVAHNRTDGTHRFTLKEPSVEYTTPTGCTLPDVSEEWSTGADTIAKPITVAPQSDLTLGTYTVKPFGDEGAAWPAACAGATVSAVWTV